MGIEQDMKPQDVEPRVSKREDMANNISELYSASTQMIVTGDNGHGIRPGVRYTGQESLRQHAGRMSQGASTVELCHRWRSDQCCFCTCLPWPVRSGMLDPPPSRRPHMSPCRQGTSHLRHRMSPQVKPARQRPSASCASPRRRVFEPLGSHCLRHEVRVLKAWCFSRRPSPVAGWFSCTIAASCLRPTRMRARGVMGLNAYRS